MRTVLDLQKQLVPDVIDRLKRRYTILRHIMISEGYIGRRALASSLQMSERVLRSEIDLLKSQGLVEVGHLGMQISKSGHTLLQQMSAFAKDLFGLAELEDQIREMFDLKQVVVVPGDSI